MVDPPLAPEDKPDAESFARLARQLLRELAQQDPALAERARQRMRRAASKADRGAA